MRPTTGLGKTYVPMNERRPDPETFVDLRNKHFISPAVTDYNHLRVTREYSTVYVPENLSRSRLDIRICVQGSSTLIPNKWWRRSWGREDATAYQRKPRSPEIWEISLNPLKPGYRDAIWAGVTTPGPNVALRNAPTSDWPIANILPSSCTPPWKSGTCATLWARIRCTGFGNTVILYDKN
jgi:hypothetical protein